MLFQGSIFSSDRWLLIGHAGHLHRPKGMCLAIIAKCTQVNIGLGSDQNSTLFAFDQPAFP